MRMKKKCSKSFFSQRFIQLIHKQVKIMQSVSILEDSRSVKQIDKCQTPMKAVLPIRVKFFFTSPPTPTTLILLSGSQYVEQFQQMGCSRIPRRTEVSFLCFLLFLWLNSALVASIIST